MAPLFTVQYKVEGSLLHLRFVKQLQGGDVPFQQICFDFTEAATVATITCSVNTCTLFDHDSQDAWNKKPGQPCVDAITRTQH